MAKNRVKHSVKIARYRSVYERYQSGESYKKIGESLNLSIERIREMCSKYLLELYYQQEINLSLQSPDSNQHLIGALDISDAAGNALRRSGIKTIGDLRTWIKNGCPPIRNFAYGSFVEVQKELADKYGE